MKGFFNSFLNNAGGLNDSDYYIGIKNGEIITGGFSTTVYSDRNRSRVLLSSTFNNTKDRFARDCLFYSLLADSQKSYSGYDVTNPTNSSLFHPYNTDEIKARKINKFKK